MVGRKKELKLFESQFASADNSLVVLYGRQGMGKTTFITEFLMRVLNQAARL